MITLFLNSIQTVISVAFNHWLDQTPQNFNIQLDGHVVIVTIQKVGDRFNCGIPGYNMDSKDILALSKWFLKT